ncbi:hypothetical protein ACFPH6_20490 [Streptomyces xiangluensis]|uniref:Uncharacterized protein n=1 Tax=Streptomyces xiangluensis TaxID=2665720 RepID=A0ABV8YQN0_9ACTN
MAPGWAARRLTGDRITDIHVFQDTERLFPHFNLPPHIGEQEV